MTKKYRRRRKKFMRKSKYNGNNTKAIILRSPTVMPDEMYVKLRYDQNYTLGPFSVFRGETLNANDLQSVITGQGAPNRPIGVEQLTPFYNNYQVLGNKVSINFMNDVDDAAVKGIEVGLVPLPQSTSIPTNMDQLKQQAYAQAKQCSEVQTQSVNLSKYMSTKKILGYKSQIEDIESLNGPLGTGSPSTIWKWFFAANPMGATTYTVNCQIHLEYYVRLFRRKTLPLSTV